MGDPRQLVLSFCTTATGSCGANSK
jgi:hypothetical protein